MFVHSRVVSPVLPYSDDDNTLAEPFEKKPAEMSRAKRKYDNYSVIH